MFRISDGYRTHHSLMTDKLSPDTRCCCNQSQTAFVDCPIHAPKTTKECKDCKRELPLTSFYKQGGDHDKYGYRSRCKACYHLYKKQWPRVDKRKETGYLRTAEYKAMSKRWRQENRDQYAARNATHYAIRMGKLVRRPCGVCGEEPTDAHHHKGYAKENRLEVVWLCKPHHQAIHYSPKNI